MNLTIMQDPQHWLAVHRTGCADIKRNLRHDPHEGRWTEDHDTLASAAASIASDFIGEGSMTLEDALSDIHFYPCVTLPAGEVPAADEDQVTCERGHLDDDGYCMFDRCVNRGHTL